MEKNNSSLEKENFSLAQIEKFHKDREKKRDWTQLLWSIFWIIVAFYSGIAFGKNLALGKNETTDFFKSLANPKQTLQNTDKGKPGKADFGIFWQAWKKVDANYVDKNKLDDQKRVYGAVRGMVDSLGDPYSGFMDPDETKNFAEDMGGSFDGIGAELGVKDGILTVIAPIEDSPAQKAGLRSGDKIIKINDKMAAEMSIDEAVKNIRGKKGTEVKLTIIRSNGDNKAKDIAIVRDTIEIKSVVYEKKENGIAYIKIKKFGEETSDEFNKAVAKAISDNSRGLILDLRNNPGGLLDSAVKITSKFVPKGEPVVWEEDRNKNRTALKAIGGDSLGDMPMVVLINEGSASASEILAGALRDIKKVELIGKKSYGKGSVQQLESLPDNSSLRITIAKWLTPSGQWIHEVGIKPDVEVEMKDEDYEKKRDPQLDKATEEILKKIR